MVKLTQTICGQQPTNCLSVFDHFVGLALKGLDIIEKVTGTWSSEACSKLSQTSTMELI